MIWYIHVCTGACVHYKHCLNYGKVIHLLTEKQFSDCSDMNILTKQYPPLTKLCCVVFLNIPAPAYIHTHPAVHYYISGIEGELVNQSETSKPYPLIMFPPTNTHI